MSCSVLFRAWPRCRAPVTLGGGMTIAVGLLGRVRLAMEVALGFPVQVDMSNAEHVGVNCDRTVPRASRGRLHPQSDARRSWPAMLARLREPGQRPRPVRLRASLASCRETAKLRPASAPPSTVPITSATMLRSHLYDVKHRGFQSSRYYTKTSTRGSSSSRLSLLLCPHCLHPYTAYTRNYPPARSSLPRSRSRSRPRCPRRRSRPGSRSPRGRRRRWRPRS